MHKRHLVNPRKSCLLYQSPTPRDKYQDIVDKLEAKRVVKQQPFHERKSAATKQRAAAATAAASQLEPINKQLEAYGY